MWILRGRKKETLRGERLRRETGEERKEKRQEGDGGEKETKVTPRRGGGRRCRDGENIRAR